MISRTISATGAASCLFLASCSNPSLVPAIEPGAGIQDNWILGGWRIVDPGQEPPALTDPFEGDGTPEYFQVTAHEDSNRYALWVLASNEALKEHLDGFDGLPEGWLEAAAELGLVRDATITIGSGETSSGLALHIADIDVTTYSGWRFVQLATPAPLVNMTTAGSMGLLPSPASYRFLVTRFNADNMLEVLDLNEQIDDLVDPAMTLSARDSARKDDMTWLTTHPETVRNLTRIAAKAFDDEIAFGFQQDPRPVELEPRR